MSYNFRSQLWLVAPLCALVFFVSLNVARIGRVEALSRAGDEAPPIDATSATGYRGGMRNLIVANHNNQSYQWIAQTQQSVSKGQWRVRFVDYDNAPFGRSVLSPSPYRWWLTLIAWCDRLFTDAPLALAIEHSAPFANPILLMLLLIASAIVVARFFGEMAAAVVSFGLLVTVPATTAFLGGEPGDFALALIAAWSGLLASLIALVREPFDNGNPAPGTLDLRWLLAGALGGVAVWLNTAVGLVLIISVTAGALLLALAERRAEPTAERNRRRWLSWALGGAVVTLIAFLVEYGPNHLGDWRLEYVHPLYGLAWLALAAIVEWAVAAIRSGRPTWRARSTVGLLVCAAAVTGTIVAIFRSGAMDAITAGVSLKPAQLFGAVGSDSLWSWARRTRAALGVIAVVLPALGVIGALIGIGFRRTKTRPRTLVVFACGPVLVFLIFGCFRLYWWSLLDLALVAVAIALIATTPEIARRPRWRWTWISAVVLGLAPSAWLLIKISSVGAAAGFTTPEVTALIERDVSHWLANRVGPKGAVVLAPPNLATSLYYHGGLHVLGTPYWDDKPGMDAAVRLAAAASPDEGQVLAKRRNVDFIVLPSWDSALDELVRASSPQPEKALIGYLHKWQPPRWLRPVPYDMPNIPGFEAQSVAVFQVVDVQDNGTALSRLAEYFVETHRTNDAIGVAATLEDSFANDFAGAVARATVANAIRDPDREAAAMVVITRNLAHADMLPWDQRVNLVIVLAQAREFDVARAQLEKCLATATEERLRFLTTASLYRLQLLCKINRLEFQPPALTAVARQLLPPELRARL